MPLTQPLSDFFNGAHVCHLSDLQELWSGYGSIARYRITPIETDTPKQETSTSHLAIKAKHNSPGDQIRNSFNIIVKSIHPPSQQQHPRGWNTNQSHKRKLRSYQVESHWYQHWSSHCGNQSRVPHCYGVIDINDTHQCIVLEDLDHQGFDQRFEELSVEQCQPCLHWLANFHAQFLRLNDSTAWTQQLWPEGSYWHLDTRPDEWHSMPESPLKQAASRIDDELNSSRFTTLIHGDAKVANFCFSPDGKTVAAVDFQYVGGGCGMKDVVYFLGSCLTEQDCKNHHGQLLDNYFRELKYALTQSQTQINQLKPVIDSDALECDWRYRYPLAWADFQRFIIGWSPTHKKNHAFAQQITQSALDQLRQDQ